jgi:hypothetical protein
MTTPSLDTCRPLFRCSPSPPRALLVALLVAAALAAPAAAQLDESCVVSALNRTAQVDAHGVWVMPNTPANFGLLRLRATCVRDGVVTSGASDLVDVPADGVVQVSDIRFDQPVPVPERLTLEAALGELQALGQALPLRATAFYPDGSRADVSARLAGTSFTTSNPAVVSVDPDGIATAVGPGAALVSASNEGAAAFLRLSVVDLPDQDGDGLPDDWELANGLDPLDPGDAGLDPDDDGLTTLEEFLAGLDPFDPDSDGDGLLDGPEPGLAGTDPRRFDTDGDGFSDGLEVTVGSDPLDPASFDLAAAMAALRVEPAAMTIVFNTVDTEAFRRLRVIAELIDGNELDVTAGPYGTAYASSDLTVASFGPEPGQVFAGAEGTATVTASCGGRSGDSVITVEVFTPVALSFLPIPGSANGVRVAGAHAYVAAGAAGLVVVDVTDLEAPAIVGSAPAGIAQDVRLMGAHAFVAGGNRGLAVVDVGTPAEPRQVALLPLGGFSWDLALGGQRAYVANGEGLAIVDVSDPAGPALMGELALAGTSVGVDLDLERGLAVVASGGGGIFVVDVSDPAAPAVVGNTHTRLGGRSRASDLVLRGERAYVADGWGSLGGVKVIDLSVPATPAVVGAGGNDFGVPDLAFERGRLFAADYFFVNAVPIFDLAGDRPIFSSFIDFSGPPSLRDDNGHGIDVRGGVVFLAATQSLGKGAWAEGGLHIGRYARTFDLAGRPPEVALTEPLPDTSGLERTSLLLAAQASDDVGVAAVRFELDGREVGVAYQPPYELTIQLSAVGQSVLRAVAVDFAGLETASEPVTIDVFPNLRPTVEILAPAAGTPVIEGTATAVVLRAEDDDAVDRVEVSVNGLPFSTLTAPPWRVDVPVNVGAETLTVGAVAVDAIGQLSEAAERSVDVQATPSGLVTIVKPTPGKQVPSGRAFEVTAASDFPGDVAYLELLVDGVPSGRVFGRDSARFDVLAPPGAGTLRLRAVGQDVAGRQAGSAEVTVSVVDVPPRVYLSAPPHGTLLVAGSPVTLEAQVVGDVAEVIFLTEGVEVGRLSAPPWQVGTTVPAGVPAVTFEAVAVDAFGLAAADSRTLQVAANAPPTVTLVYPEAGGSLVAGSDVTLTVLAGDDGQVTQVVFRIDGVDQPPIVSPPYALPYSVPAAATEVAISVTARDDGGLESTVGGVFPVLPNQPPVIDLVSPPEGTALVAGGIARFVAEVTDDLRVEEVRFRVLDYYGPGEDFEELFFAPAGPYELELEVPEGIDALSIEVTAFDGLGGVSDLERTYPVVPAEPTSVIGTVVDAGGLPVEGAAVMLPAGLGSVLSGADGAFRLDRVPSDLGDVDAVATAVLEGRPARGSSALVAPVPAGTTDLGTIVLEQQRDFTFYDLCVDTWVPFDAPSDSYACNGVPPEEGGGGGDGGAAQLPESAEVKGGGFGDGGFDVLAVTVEEHLDFLRVTLRFAAEPPDLASVWATLAFDLDQDPATGAPSAIDRLSPHAATGLGTDLEIELAFGLVPAGVIAILDDDSLVFQIPLALLGGDSAFDLAVMAYGFGFGSEAVRKERFTDLVENLRLDVAPNGGAWRLPGVPDLDTDGLGDAEEVLLGTEPRLGDSDGDQLLDGFEVVLGSDPLSFDSPFNDSDGDGLEDLFEQFFATDPLEADSDGDGLGDGEELFDFTGILPSRPDSDGDGLDDGFEAEVVDDEQRSEGGDPDSDGDGLPDGEEALAFGTEALVADSDLGGATDGQEVRFDGTDPLDGDDDLRPFQVALSSAGADPEAPRIAVGPDGRIHAVWKEEDGSDRVYYALADADGGVRIAATRVGGITLLSDPRVAVAADGRVHVIWHGRTTGRLEVYHTLLDPALDDQDGSAADPAVLAVRPEQQLSAPDSIHSVDARIALDADGRAHLVWVDLFSGSQLRHVRLGPDGGVELADHALFGGREAIDGDLSIAVDGGGDLHLVWAEDSTLRFARGLVYSLVDGATGDLVISATHLRTSQDSVFAGEPTLSLDTSGRPVIAHVLRSGPCGDLRLVALDPSLDDRDGSAADRTVLVREDRTLRSCLFAPAVHRPTLAVGPDGRRHVAFFDLEISNSNSVQLAVWDAAGDPLLAPTAASPLGEVDTDFGAAPPALAVAGPEVYLAWINAVLNELEVRRVWRDSNGDGTPDAQADAEVVASR